MQNTVAYLQSGTALIPCATEWQFACILDILDGQLHWP